MTKRASVDIRPKKSRSRKTAKRLAVKAARLAARRKSADKQSRLRAAFVDMRTLGKKIWWTAAALVVAVFAVFVLVEYVPRGGDTFPPLTYRCGDGSEFDISFSEDMARAQITPATSVDRVPHATLKRAQTEGGVLFSGPDMSFFGQGESVTLTLRGATTSCAEVHPSDEPPFNFGD